VKYTDIFVTASRKSLKFITLLRSSVYYEQHAHTSRLYEYLITI